MSAEYVSGFTVNEPAWHRLDNNVDTYPASWPEALKLAGINWDIIRVPAYMSDGGKMKEVEGQSWLIQSTTGEVLSGGSVGETYQDVTLEGPVSMGRVIEMVFDVSGEHGWDLQIETLQAIKGNTVVVATIRMKEPWFVYGDSSPRIDFFVIRNSFNRSQSFGLGPNCVRVVCANTDLSAMAFWELTGMGTQIRHTKGFMSKIEDVRHALTMAKDAQDKSRAYLDALARRRITQDDEEAFLAMVFPVVDDKGQQLGTQAIQNALNRRAQVRAIQKSETVAGAGIEGTAYGLLMATTEWSDHGRKSNSTDTLIDRVLWTGDEYKQRAMEASELLLSV